MTGSLCMAMTFVLLKSGFSSLSLPLWLDCAGKSLCAGPALLETKGARCVAEAGDVII